MRRQRLLQINECYIAPAGCEDEMGDNRRSLTQEELDSIKEQLLESIYADIGRSVIKKVLWIVGTVIFAILVGLKFANKLPG